VAGYSDNTFRPANNITRAQFTKLVTLGLGWTPVTPSTPTFADVPAGHPFYSFVEEAAAHGAVSGYTCGGPGEPCDGAHRPYFRPQADVTRGQIAKILTTARGWTPLTPSQPTFADVPAAHPFFGYVERAVAQGIISGYACGGPGEPCPGRYFRPGNPATRGQLSKILYLALTAP
jgi:N-acetylmuramoyl-L-alanine amidase